MVTCVAHGCKNKSVQRLPNVSFHKFPLDPYLRKAWTKAVGRKNWLPSASSALCSLHFLDIYFKTHTKHRRRLKDNAVPSIFWNKGPETIHPVISKPIRNKIMDGESMDYHNLPFSGDSHVFRPTIVVARKSNCDREGSSSSSAVVPFDSEHSFSSSSVTSTPLITDPSESHLKEGKSMVVTFSYNPVSHADDNAPESMSDCTFPSEPLNNNHAEYESTEETRDNSKYSHPTIIIASKLKSSKDGSSSPDTVVPCGSEISSGDASELSVVTPAPFSDYPSEASSNKRENMIVTFSYDQFLSSDDGEPETLPDCTFASAPLNNNQSKSKVTYKTSSNAAPVFRKSEGHKLSSSSARYRRYECELCGKKYNRMSHCKAHTRSHTGERPYVCSWEGCGKTFFRSDDVQRHMQIHTGERNYSCSVCYRKFRRKDHVIKHISVHFTEFQKPDISLDDDE